MTKWMPFILLIAVTMSACTGQPKRTIPAEPAKTMRHDVQDLIDVPKPASYFDPEVNLDDQAFQTLKRTRIEQLIALLRPSVDNGTELQFNPQAGTIEFTATQTEHNRVESILAMLRKSSTLQVKLEIRLVCLPPKLLNDLGMAVDGEDNLLDDFKVHRLISAAESAGDAVVVSAPQTMLANSQRGYAYRMNQTNYIGAFDSSGIRVEPVTASVEDGLVFECTPKIAVSRENVDLEFHGRYVELMRVVETPRMATVRDQRIFVQRPLIKQWDWQGKITIRDRSWVALQPTSSRTDVEEVNPEPRIELLLIKPRIIVKN